MVLLAAGQIVRATRGQERVRGHRFLDTRHCMADALNCTQPSARNHAMPILHPAALHLEQWL